MIPTSELIRYRVYLLLSCLFCVNIAVDNLIFQKFIHFQVSNQISATLSVGVLFYPLTFIITDLITEFFGKEFARFTVKVGLISCMVVMCIIYAADNLPATDWSPVDDLMFRKVFGNYGKGIIASLTAVFVAQYTDISIFSWLKSRTQNRMLWLRCNASIIIGQFVDTLCVNSVLCWLGVIPLPNLFTVAFNSFGFKICAALCSTPLFYLFYYIISALQSYYARPDSVLAGSSRF